MPCLSEYVYYLVYLLAEKLDRQVRKHRNSNELWCFVCLSYSDANITRTIARSSNMFRGLNPSV